MEVLGIEPRASCMQSRRSTTELHPLDRTHREKVCTVPCVYSTMYVCTDM